MKEAEEREGGRERGRGGDVDLLERRESFFWDSVFVTVKNLIGITWNQLIFSHVCIV